MLVHYVSWSSVHPSLNVLLDSVAGYCYIPVHSKGPKQVKVLKHWPWILGTKADKVHHRRMKYVLGHIGHIVGIAHIDIAFFQSLGKPVGVKGRNVSAGAGLNDHYGSPIPY